MATIKYVAVTEKNYRIGQDHHRAKFTDQEVRKILELHDLGLSSYRIAQIMGISRYTVRDYVSGRLRSQIPDKWRRVRVSESVRESETPAIARDSNEQ